MIEYIYISKEVDPFPPAHFHGYEYGADFFFYEMKSLEREVFSPKKKVTQMKTTKVGTEGRTEGEKLNYCTFTVQPREPGYRDLGTLLNYNTS